MIDTGTKPASLRLSKEEKKELNKEAKSNFMTLAGYLRKLVITHPDRKKK
jgi:hypothetical protein